MEPLRAPVLPHMGWNTVDAAGRLGAVRAASPHGHPVLLRALLRRARDRRWPGDHRRTHGEDFVAAVENGVVSATQFHPEKSGDAGATLLENWLATL